MTAEEPRDPAGADEPRDPAGTHVAEGRRRVSRPPFRQVLLTWCLAAFGLSYAIHMGLSAWSVVGLLLTVGGFAALLVQLVFAPGPTSSRLGKAAPWVAGALLVLGCAWLLLL
jgi:hypothetical protein